MSTSTTKRRATGFGLHTLDPARLIARFERQGHQLAIEKTGDCNTFALSVARMNQRYDVTVHVTVDDAGSYTGHRIDSPHHAEALVRSWIDMSVHKIATAIARGCLTEARRQQHHADTRRRPLLVTAFGKTLSLTAWAKDPVCPVTTGALHYRLTVLGMTPETAITTPKRRGRGTAALIEAWGIKRTVVAWAAQPECTVTATTVSSRLNRGWSPEQAISRPTSTHLGSTLVTIDGQTKTIRQWAQTERCTVSYSTVLRRLHQDMNPRVALTAPSARRRAAAEA